MLYLPEEPALCGLLLSLQLRLGLRVGPGDDQRAHGVALPVTDQLGIRVTVSDGGEVELGTLGVGWGVVLVRCAPGGRGVVS